MTIFKVWGLAELEIQINAGASYHKQESLTDNSPGVEGCYRKPNYASPYCRMWCHVYKIRVLFYFMKIENGKEKAGKTNKQKKKEIASACMWVSAGEKFTANIWI